MTGYRPSSFLRVYGPGSRGQYRRKQEGQFLAILREQGWSLKDTIWPKRELFLAGPKREIQSKEQGQFLAILTEQAWSGFIVWPKRDLFLAGPKREIPSRPSCPLR